MKLSDRYVAILMVNTQILPDLFQLQFTCCLKCIGLLCFCYCYLTSNHFNSICSVFALYLIQCLTQMAATTQGNVILYYILQGPLT